MFLSMDPVVLEFFMTVMLQFPVETFFLASGDDRPQFFTANLPRLENYFLLSAFTSNFKFVFLSLVTSFKLSEDLSFPFSVLLYHFFEISAAV